MKTDFNNTAGYHEIFALCLNSRYIIYYTQTNILKFSIPESSTQLPRRFPIQNPDYPYKWD